MKLLALDIPDSPKERALWLERQLVGIELGDLVASLHGLREHISSPVSLEELLDEALPVIVESGFQSLPDNVIREILKNPDSLLSLQERILAEGGAYWDSVNRSDDHEASVSLVWERLNEFLTDEGAHPAGAITAAPMIPPRNRLLRIVLAVAAVGFVAVTLWMNQPPPAPTGWGFNRPGTLSENLSAHEYLDHLADAANEWFNKRPETQEALALRLTQFINGCQTLIEAPHSQLTDEDREWLRDRCGVWKGKLEGQLSDLESGTKSVQETRRAADETIEKLMNALHTRAKGLAT